MEGEGLWQGLWQGSRATNRASELAARGARVGVRPPFLPEKTHRRARKNMDCRTRGLLLHFLPRHLLSCDLGRSPATVSLPCLVHNREQCSRNTDIPGTPSQLFLPQLHWADPHPTYVEMGRCFPQSFVILPKGFSPCRSSLTVFMYFFFFF